MTFSTERLWRRIDRSGGPSACWPWTGSRLPQGYGHTTDPRGHLTTATRVVWEVVTGQAPAKGMYLCHTCDNPPCVNPAHLFVGRPSDNVADAIRKGRVGKLTPDQVAEIQRLAAAGESGRSLARRFGVSPATTSRVINAVTYFHLDDSGEIAA